MQSVPIAGPVVGDDDHGERQIVTKKMKLSTVTMVIIRASSLATTTTIIAKNY